MNIRWLLHREYTVFRPLLPVGGDGGGNHCCRNCGQFGRRRFGSHDIGETGYGAFGKY